MSTDAAMEKLSESTCWELLRTVEVGRLALCTQTGPEIFPVNFVVDHGSLVFRTAPGTKSALVHEGPQVAFEADGYDADSGNAWSVVARGEAHELRGADDALDTTELALHPWHGGAKSIFVRVVPDSVSGRRFPVTDASVWINPLSGRRPTSFD